MKRKKAEKIMEKISDEQVTLEDIRKMKLIRRASRFNTYLIEKEDSFHKITVYRDKTVDVLSFKRQER